MIYQTSVLACNLEVDHFCMVILYNVFSFCVSRLACVHKMQNQNLFPKIYCVINSKYYVTSIMWQCVINYVKYAHILGNETYLCAWMNCVFRTTFAVPMALHKMYLKWNVVLHQHSGKVTNSLPLFWPNCSGRCSSSLQGI